MSFLNESGLTRYDGKLKNLLASTYSTSATYDVGDYCIHGGSLYKCTTAIAAAEAWTSGHWTKVNLGNEIDAAKEDLEKLKLDVADAYSASDSHAVGDYVVRNGVLYRCTTAIGSGGETWNAAHWTVVNIGDELVAIKADIGILKEDLADAYSSSKTYAVGDYCLKDGVLYRCTSAISTAEAWTSGHWTAVQVGEELCALNGAINDKVSKSGDTMTGALQSKTSYASNGSYSSNQWATEIYFKDANDVNIGQFRTGHMANGDEIAEFFGRRNISGSDVFNSLRLGIHPNGTKYVEFNNSADAAIWRTAFGLAEESRYSKDTDTAITTAPSSDTAILDLDTGFYQLNISSTTTYLPERYGVLEIIKAHNYGIARVTKVNASDLKVYYRTFNTSSKTWYNSTWIQM